MAHRVLLPSDVVPEVYDLSLEPDLQKHTFAGEVVVHCDVRVATDVVTVHARDLAILDASFTGEGSPALEATEIAVNKPLTTATFKFAEPLPTGKGQFKVSFIGTLNDQMAGFYRSNYTRANGQPAVMAVTQFQPIDARRCFPCWDEPAHKCVFNVTLTVPADLTALSNMPESREEFVAGDRKRVSFLPTPKMSTYLLAFCVGEYESMSSLTKDGVLLRAFSVPGKRASCAYALECGVRALEFYNDFFGIPFPLPKMDMIALPDFSMGAMENWGLVTYREVALLCDLATVSVARKQQICIIVAHELAHQWFGNLVTMVWWEDLWLNEGFATWMETFCTDHIAPEWDLWVGYVADTQQLALNLDGLRTSHPIQVPIKHAQEVEEVFDNISYCKGGSMVRMLYSVLGHEKFREGLRVYFKRHQYGNTETRDLAAAWEEVSGLPVTELVESWTLKMGFPLLRVVRDPFEGGVLEVEQSWFLADGSTQPGDEAVSWVVPLLVGTDGPNSSGPLQFTRTKSASVPVPIPAGASWLKLNFGQHVPCRVLYPPSLAARLAANVSALPAADRIGLLSDAFALCRAGHAQPEQLIALLGAYSAEASDKVWSEVASTLQRLKHVIGAGLSAEVADAYRQFAAKLVAPKAREVGWESKAGEDDNTKRLRAILAGLVAVFCAAEDWVKEAVAPLFERVVRAGDGDSGVSQDVRSAVLSVTVRNDPTLATFERLQKLHAQSNDDALKREIYSALGKGPAEVQRLALQWNLTDEVKAQDMLMAPSSAAASGLEGAEATLQWVRADYDRLHARLGTSRILFAHIVRVSGAGFATREKAAEVEEFWKSRPIYAAVQKTVGQVREAIETSAQFVERLRASPLSAPAFWAAH